MILNDQWEKFALNDVMEIMFDIMSINMSFTSKTLCSVVTCNEKNENLFKILMNYKLLIEDPHGCNFHSTY